MVWRIIFSLVLLYAGSCDGSLYDISTYNTYADLAYRGLAIIFIMFTLYHIYQYFRNKQEREKIKAAAWNYVMGLFILMALPGYAIFMCEMFKFFFQDVVNSSVDDYMSYSQNTLQTIIYDIEHTIYIIYDKSIDYSARASQPFISPSVSVQLPGCVAALLLVIFSDLDPRTIPTSINYCVQVNQVSYFPERQYTVYLSLLTTIKDTYSLLYTGFLLHKLILDIIAQGWFATFVPIGVVARFLPGLRKPGDVLIALGFGMHIIYPFVYSMFLSTFEYIVDDAKINSVFLPNGTRPPYDININLYKVSAYTLLAITLPNLAAATVAVFVSNAFKVLDVLEM